MSQFEYDIVQTEYGKQLAVSFDYDEETVAKIKTLPWDVTHRKWSDEHEAWLIDYDEQSLDEFEQWLNVVIPPQYTPDSGNSKTIKAVVPDGYTWFFLQNATTEIDDLLYQELAYFNDAYRIQDQEWIRLYKRDNSGAPIGLLDRARELIEAAGHELTVQWHGERRSSPVDLDWQFPHELRDYQRQAVEAVKQNGGGIVGLPTGTGKTVVAMRLLKELSIEAGRGIVLVHTKELLEQWTSELEDTLNCTVGAIGDGRWSEGDVTVAIMQTLMSRDVDQLEKDYGIAIYDECHRTSAADTMYEIGMELDTETRIGLSATPWRRIDGEELKIEGVVGGTAYTATAEQMIDNGYLATPQFEIIDVDNARTAGSSEDYHDAYRRCISLDSHRNSALAHKTAQLADNGHTVLVNVDQIKHGRLLEYMLNDTLSEQDITSTLDFTTVIRRQKFVTALQSVEQIDAKAAFMHGSDSSSKRQTILENFENGDLDILISTLLKEGTDIPSISALVYASAGKSDIAMIQSIGRALRPQNGDQATIVDVKDKGRFFGQQFTKRTQAMNDYYGAYGPSE